MKTFESLPFLSTLSLDMDCIANHSQLIGAIVAVGAGCFLLKWYTAGGWCHNRDSLAGKTVLITGANTGIGKETAVELASRGAQVVIAVRDTSRGTEAAEDIFRRSGRPVDIKRLDLADLENVKSFAESFSKYYDRLDVLINNAAVFACPYQKSADGYELHIATNHLGHFLLTNLLLDLLKKSAPSRIVNVGAKAAEFAQINFDDINSEQKYSPIGAYCQSKLANMLFTQELSRRLKGTGVSVFCLHPGVIKTTISRHLEERMPWILRFLSWVFTISLGKLIMKSLRGGAQTTVYCAVEPGLEKFSGEYFSDCRLAEVPSKGKNEADAKRLWELSETMVKEALGRKPQ